MLVSVKLPRLGADASSAVVVAWNADVGAAVTAGEPLVSVGLDKVDVDVPSPVSGILVSIQADEGAEVAVGDVICAVET